MESIREMKQLTIPQARLHTVFCVVGSKCLIRSIGLILRILHRSFVPAKTPPTKSPHPTSGWTCHRETVSTVQITT
jgi:hypothetical protein